MADLTKKSRPPQPGEHTFYGLGVLMTRTVRFVLTAVISMSIFAGEVSANGKRPVPKPLTMEEKVKGSDVIFIGETVRVFFTDDRGNELNADPEYPTHVASWLTVRAKRVLWNTGEAVGAEMTINYPNDGSPGPYLRERYLGKEWIFFVRVVRSRWNVSGRTEIRQVLRFTPGRWLVYPLPVDQLDDVMATINILRAKDPSAQRVK